MTEKEAIETLRAYKEVVDRMIDYCRESELKEDKSGYLKKKVAFEMAISALEEIQKYREIGTVEEIKDLLVTISEASEDVDESGISTGLIKDLVQLAKYRKIGTVEECRVAVEKREPKKSDMLKGLIEKIETHRDFALENNNFNAVATFDFCAYLVRKHTRERIERTPQSKGGQYMHDRERFFKGE